MAFESSDASLVPIERPVWSDSGVGYTSFFSRVFSLDFNQLLGGIDAHSAGISLL